MTIHWTRTAIDHLEAIHDYISQDSRPYADRTIERLTRRSQQIAEYPQSGRRVPETDKDDVREVIEGSYRLIYRIREDQVDVLAVIHTARELPPSLINE